MKVILLFFIFAYSITSPLRSQNDPQAIKILDSFSSKASKAPSVSMSFSMITTNLTENKSDTVKGSLILSGDKYKLILGDNTVWFNGTTNWNYLDAEKEVTITKPDKKDHSFQNRPSEIFSMYKSGYKSRLIEEKAGSYIIDLYPEDIRSELVRVRLDINKPDLDLINMEYKRSDGIVIILKISKYDLKQKPDPGTFIFQPEKYKEAEINDMR
jgi:outer membrane lipoprotein carrier protein